MESMTARQLIGEKFDTVSVDTLLNMAYHTVRSMEVYGLFSKGKDGRIVVDTEKGRHDFEIDEEQQYLFWIVCAVCRDCVCRNVNGVIDQVSKVIEETK